MPFENWEADNKTSIAKWAIIGLIIFIAIVGTVFAADYFYKITSPPSEPVDVNVRATLSKPTTNSTAAIIGDTIQITTVLSTHEEGFQVTFKENGDIIGSAYTNDQGQAIYNRVMTSTGTFVYIAECIYSPP